MAGGSEEAATGAGCSLSEGSAERLLPKTLEKKLPLSGSVSAGAAWAEALVSEAVGVEVTLTTRTLSAGGWRTGAGSGSGSAVKLGSRLSLGSSFLGRMFSGWSAGSLLRGAGSGGVRSLMSGSGDSFRSAARSISSGGSLVPVVLGTVAATTGSGSAVVSLMAGCCVGKLVCWSLVTMTPFFSVESLVSGASFSVCASWLVAGSWVSGSGF